MSELLTGTVLKRAQSRAVVGYIHDSRDYEHGNIFQKGKGLPNGVSVAKRWVGRGGCIPWVEVLSTGDIRIILQGPGTPPKVGESVLLEGLGSPENTIAWLEQYPQGAVIEAACAMFNSPKAGIGQLKAAVKAYEDVKKYRIYKMGSGGSTITDWPALFESSLAAEKWAVERKLADDLGLHEYLEVRDEITGKVAKYL